MKTAIETLFEAMMTDGWMTASDGDVEAPTGAFAYVTNTSDEITSILDAFSDTVEMTEVDHADLVGSFVVHTNEQGQTFIDRVADDDEARRVFGHMQDVFEMWHAGYGV